jgi:hypothetical protein
MTWLPIESAPKDGDGRLRGMETGPTVLLSDGGKVPYIGFWNGVSWDDGDWNNDMGEMTHWMPLPPPPGNATVKEGE